MSTNLAEIADLALGVQIPDVQVDVAPVNTDLVPNPAPGELESVTADLDFTFDGGSYTVEQALADTPENDIDLESMPTFEGKDKLVKEVIKHRVGKRVLAKEATELQPYRALGDLESVKASVELANRLTETAILDRNNRPLLDSEGRVQRDFTGFFDYMKKECGEEFIEALANQAFQYPTENEFGKPEKIVNQMFRSYDLDPNRIPEYRDMDTRLAQASGAVSLEALSLINPKYHDAYKSLPAFEREDWASYTEDRQLALLQKAKLELDNARYIADQRNQDEVSRQQSLTNEIARIEQVAVSELMKLRQEKVRQVKEQLKQVVFSSDPKTNVVLRDMCIAFGVMALEPAWHIAVEDGLAALDQKLDKTFNQMVESVGTLILNEHLFRSAGDNASARDASAKGNNAINMAMARVYPIIMAGAKIAGAVQMRKGEKLADALERAQKDVIPRIPDGKPSTGDGRILPPDTPVDAAAFSKIADMAIAGASRS